MNNLAYSYVRFSSAQQAEGDSERRQLAKFDVYCKRKGLTPAPISFADRGRSGFKKEHLSATGELRRFLDLVEDGTIEPGSTLVVENLDRLGRQEVEHALAVFTLILNADITIATLGGSEGEREYRKGGGPIPLLIGLIEMTRAHGESQRKVELATAAIANKQEAARKFKAPIGNNCPLWLQVKEGWRDYETDGSGYEERPERADVVRRIFALTLEGYGKEVVARKLNEEGIPPFKANAKWKKPQNGPRLWGSSSIDKILKNKATFGEYHPTTRQRPEAH
ncbi:hypothetical protein AU476_09215 [Cupriavidus sp. UYMSc13B]|nr:hypothetical protein AU476_09215 [Cupriavidus sp. UYMSc13B]